PAFPMSFSTAAIGSTETSSLKSKRARGQSKPRPVDALHSGASNAQTADHVKKAPPAIRPFFPRDDGGGARAHRLHFRHDLAPGGRNDRRHRCHWRLTRWYPRRVSARRTDPLQTNGSYDASHWVKRSSSGTMRSASHSSSSRIETARFSL